MLEPGDIVDHKYRVEREAGRGGFSTVYEARDLASDRLVAIKVLHHDDGARYSASTTARFRREVQCLAKLRGQHVVRLLDHGAADCVLFAVFEFLEGESLAKLLEIRGRFTPDEVVHILRQLLVALAEAHRRGILHRDLKPENVIITQREDDGLFVRLIDFGIARPLDDGSPSLTATGELIGTPRYMPPEQITGDRLTPASDLYSCGVMAFELAFGRGSLHGPGWMDQLDRLTRRFTFTPAQTRDLPPVLGQVIQRLTTIDRDHRFQSAEAALRALDSDSPVAHILSVEQPRTATRWWAVGLALVAVFATAVFALRDSPPTPHRIDHETTPAHVTTPPRRASEPQPTPPSDAAGPTGGCAASEPAQSDELSRADILRGLETTTVYWMAPPTAGEARPLLLFLGDVNRDLRLVAEGTGFLELAREHNFAFVAATLPERQTYRSGHRVVVVDEIQALEAATDVLEWARSRFCVGNLLVVAHGQGGVAAEPMACSGAVDAVAVYGHRLSSPADVCPIERKPAPILQLLPTRSAYLPIYIDDRDCYENRNRTSAADVDRTWADYYGCRDPEIQWNGERNTRCANRTQCETTFETCMIDGGLPWPDTRPRPDDPCDGPPPEFDVTQKIWEFFERQLSD